MKEKAKRFFKNPLGIGLCCLVGSLVMSFGAQLVNTSGYSVQVTSGVADMDQFYAEQYKDATAKPLRLMTVGAKKDGMVNAKMAYDLYLPKGVSAENPAPAVALTHGYLNSKEFEEGFAIELARRGYVVFAYDQYDHGDSTWDTPSAFNFYVWSAYDAVEFLAAQDYVMTAADGTKMIGVSGHSMGGFSSEIAVAWDQLNLDMGVYSHPKTVAVLAQGADFRYVDAYVAGYSGGAYANTYATYKSRTAGALQGEYDEFFFDNSGKGKGNVIEKDYASDKVGYGMLGLTKPGESNKFYQVDPATGTALTDEITDLTGNYGERIIYKVAGDHPYNTWSPQAASCIIDFFNHAFEHQTALHGSTAGLEAYGINPKDGSHQIWWIKEVFTGIGMLMVLAAVLCGLIGLVNVPVFRLACTDATLIPEVEPTSKPRKAIGTGLTIFSILLSGFMIPALMSPGGNAANAAMLTTILDVFMYASFAAALILALVAGIFKAAKKDGSKELVRPAGGALLISVIALALRWLINDGTGYVLNSTNRWFNAPSVNTIAFWAVASGLLALIFALISHFFVNPNRTVAHLGLKASWKQVGVSLLNAIVVSGVICAFVWIISLIFNVDFRMYTYAIKTVNGGAFLSALHYLPFFFLFYFCSGISLAVATAGKKGWKADAIAVAIEVLPCALFLVYQYTILMTTGVAPFPNFDLNGILVQGLIWTLIFLAIYQRRSLEKNGNIWNGVFLNTIFFTFLTLGNTCLYLLK